MCDLKVLKAKEADLRNKVGETEEGIQAAQELVMVRRAIWAKHVYCGKCRKA